VRVAISNDHAGFSLKQAVVDRVRSLGHVVIDVGTADDSPVDFPVMTRRVTDLIIAHDADRGLLVCGTGVGAAMAANKVMGIRAAVIHDSFVARQCVEHDDANVACLGAWIVGRAIAEDAIAAFLTARFADNPDVRRRVHQLAELEIDLARSVSGSGLGDSPRPQTA
jgi:ribose 5-phosphate isomerase B